jgi:cell division protein FtsI (penicillin-binding protein 3)
VAQQPITFAWRPVIRRRIAVAAALFAVWTAAIEVRLIYLQVVRYDELSARAERQQLHTIAAPAKRGEIFDRNGRMLAFSVDADTVYAVPTEIGDRTKTAAELCRVLDDCSRSDQNALVDRLSKQRAFVYVKRRVTPEEARKVAALNLDGIGFMQESRRFYPNRELAANVVGYVGLDNVGLHGIESTYDKVIRGREGKVLVQTDARRHAFSRVERTPTSGGSLELTIDEGLQYIVERELKDGVIDNRAKGGAAIVMDPYTGEILAMANYPTFNPNAYNGADADVRRNRAVQDLYEPGSTFKIVTASAALEEKVWRLTDMIDVSSGSYSFGSSVVHDMARNGVLSFKDVIVKSSNVGAIKIGLRVGPERMGLYVNRFGFGRPSSPDFPGESPGIVYNPAKLNDRALGSVSMGYQVGVTPLQMAAAVSAVANGGNLMEPRIIRAVVRDGVRTQIAPKITRRAIEAGTAAELTGIMEAVVTDGTAKAARLDGYTVAGKTGTAEKLIDGHYSNTEHNASFVGFVPSRAPRLTVVVLLDTPRAHGNTGGVTSAPLFKKIADAALRHLGVPPNVNPEPPVMVARRGEERMEHAMAPLPARGIVTLTAAGDGTVVPDLRGMGARDALRALGRLGLGARVQGDGVVVDQTPAPGYPLEPGSTCVIVLGREPMRSVATAGAQP